MSNPLPYIPFYYQDYQSDTRRLSLEARGLWMEILCFLWRQGGGRHTLTAQQLGQICGVPTRTVNRVVVELISNSIGDISQTDGLGITLESRRLNSELTQSKPELNSNKTGTKVDLNSNKSRVPSHTRGDIPISEPYIPPTPQGAKTQIDEHVDANPREVEDPHLADGDAPLMARLGSIFRMPGALQWSDITRQAFRARRGEIEESHLSAIERYYAAKYDPANPADKMRCKTLHSLLENWSSEVGCALAWVESVLPLIAKTAAEPPPTPDQWHPVWRQLYQTEPPAVAWAALKLDYRQEMLPVVREKSQKPSTASNL